MIAWDEAEYSVLVNILKSYKMKSYFECFLKIM